MFVSQYKTSLVLEIEGLFQTLSGREAAISRVLEARIMSLQKEVDVSRAEAFSALSKTPQISYHLTQLSTQLRYMAHSCYTHAEEVADRSRY